MVSWECFQIFQTSYFKEHVSVVTSETTYFSEEGPLVSN